MALPENFIYQLKQNNPIDSVMSSYVRLQRRGIVFVPLPVPFRENSVMYHL